MKLIHVFYLYIFLNAINCFSQVITYPNPELIIVSKITTIEGLANSDGKLHPVPKAWMEENVPQCGYCQPGQIMATAAFLENNPNPTDEEIDDVMSGNICRCGTYDRIKKAIKKVKSS